jgi:hypothetical protein
VRDAGGCRPGQPRNPADGAVRRIAAEVSRYGQPRWVELVAYHAAEFAGGNFDTFADHHPALLDKRLLTRFYRSSTLADARAKAGWVEPDLASFPWQEALRDQ